MTVSHNRLPLELAILTCTGQTSSANCIESCFCAVKYLKSLHATVASLMITLKITLLCTGTHITHVYNQN